MYEELHSCTINAILVNRVEKCDAYRYFKICRIPVCIEDDDHHSRFLLMLSIKESCHFGSLNIKKRVLGVELLCDFTVIVRNADFLKKLYVQLQFLNEM